MAQQKVKKVKSLEETKNELQKLRQAYPERFPRTISAKVGGKTTESYTIGPGRSPKGTAEPYGALGRGIATGGKKKVKKPKKGT